MLMSRAVVTMAGIDRIDRGQDGQVFKAPSLHCRERTKYTPDKRGIEILSLQNVRRLGGWWTKTRPNITMAGIDQIEF